MRSTPLPVALLAICVLVLLAPVVEAGEYRDADRGFRFDLPEGWMPLRPEVLDQIRNAPNGSRTIAGFDREGGERLAMPCVQVEFRPLSFRKSSLAELEAIRDMRILDSTAGRSFAEIWRGLRLDEIWLDRDRVMMYGRKERTLPGSGKVAVVAVQVPSLDGLFQFTCLAMSTELERGLPDFEAIVSSFALDPGKVWSPPDRGERTGGDPATGGDERTGGDPATGGGERTGGGPAADRGERTGGGPATGGGERTGRGPAAGGGERTGRGPAAGGGSLLPWLLGAAGAVVVVALLAWAATAGRRSRRPSRRPRGGRSPARRRR